MAAATTWDALCWQCLLILYCPLTWALALQGAMFAVLDRSPGRAGRGIAIVAALGCLTALAGTVSMWCAGGRAGAGLMWVGSAVALGCLVGELLVGPWRCRNHRAKERV